MTATDLITSNKGFYAGVLPPHRDYVTEALIFPGTNAREPWKKSGTFRFVCRIMSQGGEIARTEPRTCTEQGHVIMNLDSCMTAVTEPGPSFLIMEVESSSDIPVSFYFAHIHRKTGLYYPAPALMFMGDKIYTRIHSQQLENTLFWPGLPDTSNTEFRLVIINPYDVPMSIEVTAWHNTWGHCSSGVLRVSPSDCLWLPLDEWIPSDWRGAGGPSSVSVAAQFKLVAFMIMVNRTSGVITSADHLHTYQLH